MDTILQNQTKSNIMHDTKTHKWPISWLWYKFDQNQWIVSLYLFQFTWKSVTAHLIHALKLKNHVNLTFGLSTLKSIGVSFTPSLNKMLFRMQIDMTEAVKLASIRDKYGHNIRAWYSSEFGLWLNVSHSIKFWLQWKWIKNNKYAVRQNVLHKNQEYVFDPFYSLSSKWFNPKPQKQRKHLLHCTKIPSLILTLLSRHKMTTVFHYMPADCLHQWRLMFLIIKILLIHVIKWTLESLVVNFNYQWW